MSSFDPSAEWLEADSHGGFASGGADGVRTRRYHALLLCATTPPTGRMVLVNGLEVWAETNSASVALSAQRYAPDVVYPDGAKHIEAFCADPWPTWFYALPDGATLTQEIFVSPQSCETFVWWRLTAGGPRRLRVRPLISGRNYHALHHENDVFNFTAEGGDGAISFRPYPGVPPIGVATNAAYQSNPVWYRNFLYSAEVERGLDAIEDLASPGEFLFELSLDRPALMILQAGAPAAGDPTARGLAAVLAERERRASFPSRLARSAASYRVERGAGSTIVAGYPWFTDWGRDSFMSLRGLALGVGDRACAERILTSWAPFVSEGMLPNRFPDDDGAPEYNSVDAALWYVVAAYDWLSAADAEGAPTPQAVGVVQQACEAILAGYSRGARYNIGADSDGLLKAGEQGLALTWMDARVGGVPVTARIGKPVEVQALWINALRASALWTERWSALARRASASFAERFSCPSGGLYDVVDVDHVAGRVDAKLRPNQILAAGGLPFPIVAGGLAAEVVTRVESALLTPLGLRTLAPDDPAYVGRYIGGPTARDSAYHQGSAWPWLLGPFVDAWLRARGAAAAAKEEARARFLAPLMRHLDHAGLGHVSELADGDAPHQPRGCPFQAWSLGELIRIDRLLDAKSS